MKDLNSSAVRMLACNIILVLGDHGVRSLVWSCELAWEE
jgi:hypothetical protein